MSKRVDIPVNVRKFAARAAEAVGNHAHEIFAIDMQNEFADLGIKSPIEQLFYAAFSAVIKINHVDNDAGWFCNIKPQAPVGKYRADFVVSYVHLGMEKSERLAVIECDGHDFHDRSEKDRRYEKQRDRWMQTQGYKVFRFTGKEIADDPFNAALEVVAFLSMDNIGVMRAQLDEYLS